MWLKLSPRYTGAEGLKEKAVQSIFDAWDKRGENPAFRFAGVPDVLKATTSSRRPHTVAFGYSFTPDGVFETDTETLIVEIKRAAKYEPLALAEALHHAEFFETYQAPREYKKPVRPVIVSSYNCWLRLAIAFLARNSFDVSRLTYVELDWLTFGERNLLWLDEPFAKWEEVSSPPFDFAGPAELNRWQWHYVKSNQSWVGTEGSRAALNDERPTIIEGAYTAVAKVEQGDQFVVWQGHGIRQEEARPEPDSSESEPIGEFFLWDPRASGNCEGPPWVKRT